MIVNYSIEQFVLYELKNNEMGIQNAKGFTLLRDKRIQSFFKHIDSDNRLSVDDKYLDSYFGNEADNIKKYLISNGLIREKIEKKFFDTISIYTNNEVINSSVRFNTSGSRKKIRSTYFKNSNELYEHLKMKNIPDSSLSVIVLIPFDYIDFLKINDTFQEKNVPYLIGISYNSKIYLTNIHKKNWYNPCPKCFFSQLEASLRAYNKNTSEITFQTIVDLLYSRDIMFSPSLPVNNSNIVPLIQSILNLDLSMEIEDLSNRITEIELNNVVKFDQAIHWELCDCFE